MDRELLFQKELLEAIIYTFSAFLLLALVLVLFFYFSRKKIIKYELQKKDLEISYQKDLLQAVIVTQEEERKRIAQDLHDDISSKLNVISLHTHMLKVNDLSESERSEITTNIINFTKRAIDDSRRLAHDLLPPVLEKFGLDAGVRELCLEFQSSKAVNVHYQNLLVFDQNDVQNHLHLFRILQELMNNSVRHGKANHIHIDFLNHQNNKVCKYSDDGVGFDLKKQEYKKGLGMKNIESRVAILNGKLEIESSVKNGISVLITF
ncbi:histidine kinase [Flavobacterium enshiense]|uniref:sensor histidine kinase n=1 Tax=Flavobacterium enshiense TaxID=1341165 RepID=UPI00345DD6DA